MTEEMKNKKLRSLKIKTATVSAVSALLVVLGALLIWLSVTELAVTSSSRFGKRQVEPVTYINFAIAALVTLAVIILAVVLLRKFSRARRALREAEAWEADDTASDGADDSDAYELLPECAKIRSDALRAHLPVEKNVSIEGIDQALSEHLAINGVTMPRLARISFVSAVAAGRAVVIFGVEGEAARHLCAVLETFFRSYAAVCDRYTSDAERAFMLFGADGTESDFLKSLYSACCHEGAVSATAFIGASADKLNASFPELLAYADNPSAKHMLDLHIGRNEQKLAYVENGALRLPDNMRYIICLEAGAVPSAELAKNATYIDLECTLASEAIVPNSAEEYTASDAKMPDADEEAVPTEKPARASALTVYGDEFAVNTDAELCWKDGRLFSDTALARAVKDAAEVKALSLEIWNKLDKLADYLNGICGFVIDNKLARAIERYSGACLVCGMSETETLDCVLAARILPMLLAVPRESFYHADIQLPTKLYDLFGSTNLPITHRVLRKTRLDVIG